MGKVYTINIVANFASRPMAGILKGPHFLKLPTNKEGLFEQMLKKPPCRLIVPIQLLITWQSPSSQLIRSSPHEPELSTNRSTAHLQESSIGSLQLRIAKYAA